MHNHIPREVVEEYRESLKSEFASREFHRKYPDFCNKTMDYFEKMGRFAENAATKDDLNNILGVLDDHHNRLLDLEGMKADIKNIIDMAAQFARWKEKVYRICAIGFLIMVAKSVGIPDWAVKILAAMAGS